MFLLFQDLSILFRMFLKMMNHKTLIGAFAFILWAIFFMTAGILIVCLSSQRLNGRFLFEGTPKKKKLEHQYRIWIAIREDESCVRYDISYVERHTHDVDEHKIEQNDNIFVSSLHRVYHCQISINYVCVISISIV